MSKINGNTAFCALCEKEHFRFEMSSFRSAPGTGIDDGAICADCSRNGKQEVATPQNGGCWYCHRKDGSLVFDCEFDTFVHKSCTAKALKTDPRDREARIIARSIGLIVEEDNNEQEKV